MPDETDVFTPNPRQHVLVQLLRSSGSTALDPIRIMKGLFIVDRETPIDWLPAEHRYSFVPEKYGPCSYQVYNDLNALLRADVVTAFRAPGKSWNYYSLSENGKRLADELATALPTQLNAFVSQVATFVKTLPFSELLRKVYARYPDFAVNSVFKYQPAPIS